MELLWFALSFLPVCVVLLSPDAGDGSGGAGDPDPEPEKKFSEKDVEGFVQKRLKQMNSELTAKDKTITELQESLKSLTDEVAAIKGSHGNSDDPQKDIEGGQQRVELKRLENIVADLTKKLESETKLREETEQSRREMDRDNKLSRALAEAHCEGGEPAEVYFRSKLYFDKDENEWLYRNKEGKLVDISSGVTVEMPHYCKPASMRGGSGATTTPKRAAQQKRLQDEEAKLKQLRQNYANSQGNQTLFSQVTKQMKVVEALQRELSTAS